MTTLVPRQPYSRDELDRLYPAQLKLQLVQILMRHGERSPVSARFQNTGLPAFWPYCSVVTQLKAAVMDPSVAGHAHFDIFSFRRRLETFGSDESPVIARGPRGELDAICDMGMLTDKGRESTYELGRRLRKLYVEQLRFLPPVIADTDSLYLRATPIPRALDSLQQTFLGLYPKQSRVPDLAPPVILTRGPQDETLFPNDGNCRRFAALSRAFAQRSADRWNTSDEMAYLTKLWGKWMPQENPNVAVDSHPRLSGIMDTINSTLAHGPDTRLPKEFYDPKARAITEKINVEEWFAGYKESAEYRMLGIGGLMGDILSRMVGSAERSTADGEYEVARDLDGKAVKGGHGATPIRFGLSGCHDTTLAAVLTSLGTYERDKWPPYTSHIAIEMFKHEPSPSSTLAAAAGAHGPSSLRGTVRPTEISAADDESGSGSGWLGKLFSWRLSSPPTVPGLPPPGVERKRHGDLTDSEKSKLDGYYVRLRFNDEVMTVPGCGAPGKHLEGDASFCTLDAFKAIVDKFVPRDWKAQCRANVNAPAFPSRPEPAGY